MNTTLSRPLNNDQAEDKNYYRHPRANTKLILALCERPRTYYDLLTITKLTHLAILRDIELLINLGDLHHLPDGRYVTLINPSLI